MKTKNVILFIVCLLVVSCNKTYRQDENLKNLLTGEWEMIREVDTTENYFRLEYPRMPYAIAFLEDSIEFFNGFYQTVTDTITRKRMSKYNGSFVSYKIQNGNIFIKNIYNNNWEFYRKFVKLFNDTLELAINDTTKVKFLKLTYDLDTIQDFDQIVYSSSGCYGSCPIIDISVDKNGEIYFQGEGYASKIGFFNGRINNTKQAYIFNKFKKANPINLLKKYQNSWTDQAEITTTFIKNGKIIKTISDYGDAAPQELLWAYVPISNLHDIIELDSLLEDEPFFPKLHYYFFQKGRIILPLQKSESFYLWTEIHKSKVTEQTFKPIYSLSFGENFTYWGPNPNRRQHRYEYKKITTDGRFFKFEYKNRTPITYDLGYNFIERNFEQNDFIKE